MNQVRNSYSEGVGTLPCPASPIEQVVNVIRETQGQVHIALDMLEQALGPVLRPGPPNESGDGKASPRECGQSPLHEELIARSAQVESINARIHGIAKRITV